MEYLGKKIWQEDPSFSDNYRRNYVEGIDQYVARMNRECKQHRHNNMSPNALIANPEKYRTKYCELLGLDLFKEPSSKPSTLVYVGSDDVGKIYRLTVYITDEIPFYALLVLPHNVEEPMPLVVAQHGGDGTPELCCDMYGKNNYNHMVQRALARKAAVLAPQLMLWSTQEGETVRGHDVPRNRYKADNSLKRFGSSITALEISGIMKCLDYVCDMSCIDEKRVAMIGLSYGGYFTLHTMAADLRIKAGYCAGVFNDRDIYDWSDWSYKGAAFSFQDAEVAALCAPRKLYIQIGVKDEVFNYSGGCSEVERVYDYFTAYACPENFKFDVWNGGHTVSDHDEGYDFIFDALSVER